MSFGQGDVVVAGDPFGRSPRRPYLVVSNERRPFRGEDYLVAGITTTEREDAVPLADGLGVGDLDRESYVSPWTVLTIRHTNVTKRIAVVTREVVIETVEAIGTYVALQ